MGWQVGMGCSPNSNAWGHKLHITRLKLSGFKSFVEPAELIIEQGLTGIVGPNGCGKSNLLEAIRWVMGETSSKSMRSQGMDDVIFAGTSSRPARNFAEVALKMDGVAELGEVEVIRRIERGAGSGYRLNGKDVRAKDIGLMFADAATGAHSSALVSQGRVAAVIAAKPQERRAMLEEAAAISGLHVRRKDAEARMRATESNLLKLDDLKLDLENRIGSLKKQAKAAERYKLLSAQIRVADARQLFVKWQGAAKAAAAAREQATRAEQQVAAALENQTALTLKQQAAVNALVEARAATMKARDALSSTLNQLANTRSERAQVTRRLAEIEAQSRQISSDQAREAALARDAREALTALVENIAQLDAALKAGKLTKPALDTQLQDADMAGAKADTELAQAQAALAAIQAEWRVADANVHMAQQQHSRAQQECMKLDGVLKTLGESAAMEAALAQAKHAAQAAQADILTSTAALEQAEAQRQSETAAQSAAQSAQGQAQAEYAALEAEQKSLAKSLAAVRTGNKALDALKAQSGYERALAAALGDEIEASLSPDAARYWGGSADAENPALPEATAPALPSGALRLADYVEAPPQLAARLAQVAVVEQDSGQPLAQGQRLVTRAGDMRRWDGYVTKAGSSSQAERLIRQNRLAVLEAELAPAHSRLEAARGNAHSAREALARTHQAAEAARTARTQAEAQLRHAQRSEDQQSAALDRLIARREELHSNLKARQAEVAEALTALEAAQAARLALADGATAQTAVREAQVASETKRRAIAELRAQTASHAREQEARATQLAQAKAQHSSWEARAKAAEQRLGEMGTRVQTNAEEAETLAQAPARLAQEIAALEAQEHSVKAHAQEAERQEKQTQAALSALEKDLAALGETMAQAREMRAGSQTRAAVEEERRGEMARLAGDKFACPPPLLPRQEGFDETALRAQEVEVKEFERFTQERDRLGPVNLLAEKDLEEITGTLNETMKERDELQEAVNRLRGSIGSLNRESRARLLEAFDIVDAHFQRLFGRLFNGGQAHLKLIDSQDPLEAGLEIFAQPPGKKLTSLTLLSGGEQALTAIALIFALFLTNPAPICVLDEVDAPLDDANIERFCDLLHSMVGETRTRYLIVTHNAVTMSRMHRLFGVTMVEQGVSRLVSVEL
jgi:chromosome segregation protein